MRYEKATTGAIIETDDPADPQTDWGRKFIALDRPPPHDSPPEMFDLILRTNAIGEWSAPRWGSSYVVEGMKFRGFVLA